MSFKDNPSVASAGVFLLLVDFMLYPGFDRMKHVPPLAILLAVFMVLLHWRIIYPGYDDPWEMCVSADRVFDDGEYTPLFVSSFEHASNLHLFCNMASFVWTAACLEHKLHPLYFIYMLFSFAWICNLAEIAIAEITTRYFHDEWARYACAIGFSDVLFALKILLVCYPATHEKWREGYLLRYLPCPSLSLVTLEFALLHLFVPEASLQSHLAGVIVGMLYVAGPLSWPMNALWNKLTLGWGTCCGKLNHPLVYMLGMTVDDQGYIVKPGMENNPYYGQTKILASAITEAGTSSSDSSEDEDSSGDTDSQRDAEGSSSKKSVVKRKSRKSRGKRSKQRHLLAKKPEQVPKNQRLRPPPPPKFPPPDGVLSAAFPGDGSRRKRRLSRGGIQPSMLPLADLTGITDRLFGSTKPGLDSRRVTKTDLALEHAEYGGSRAHKVGSEPALKEANPLGAVSARMASTVKSMFNMRYKPLGRSLRAAKSMLATT